MVFELRSLSMRGILDTISTFTLLYMSMTSHRAPNYAVLIEVLRAPNALLMALNPPNDV